MSIPCSCMTRAPRAPAGLWLAVAVGGLALCLLALSLGAPRFAGFVL